MLSRRLKLGVVGASGFIGTALVKSIVQSPWADVFLFGRQEGWVEGVAVSPLGATSESLSGLDVIIHLSAITSSRGSKEELRQANVDLAVETATAAAAAGVKRFIFLSSLAVHGKSAKGLIGPEAPIKPHNAYGASKALAETELTQIAKNAGMELVILRPPMVYGPKCKGSFAQLARLVQTGLPMPFSRADGKRSFCSVSNLVSAIRYTSETPVPPSVLIPADPEDFDTRSLVLEMGQAMGRKVRFLPVPKMLLIVPMTLAGRRDTVTSLFEPLQIDRAHWAAMEWQPIESANDAVKAALAPDRPDEQSL